MQYCTDSDFNTFEDLPGYSEESGNSDSGVTTNFVLKHENKIPEVGSESSDVSEDEKKEESLWKRWFKKYWN